MNVDKMVEALQGAVTFLGITGSIQREVTGLAYDTRDVKDGYAFFALKGIHTDGHRFITDAIKHGASVVFHSEDLDYYNTGTTYLKVSNTRTCMAPVSACFYGYPSEKLTCIGVTGTDGKSTTVSLLHQLLRLSGIKAGFISTVQFDTGDGAQKNHYRQSTPEATEIHKILCEMVENGCTHAVIEATSHGLSPLNNRLGSIDFTAGILTNISHEHLEFHKTLERYVDDKANLFRRIKAENGFGVINGDEPRRAYFASASAAPVVYYSTKNRNADIFADAITETPAGESFTIHAEDFSGEADINLPGIFNVENTLAAVLTVSRLTGKSVKFCIPFLPQLRPVAGRMNFIKTGKDFRVLVDYAHTPGAYLKLFPILRKRTEGRLIAVFGSAGERDTEKRQVQGEIASRYADIIILTDEDPRGEDPQRILEDIKEGCRQKTEGKDLFLVQDRREAIKAAIRTAGKGDLVVLLGKGHESSIIYSDGPSPWDEKAEAEKALAETGVY